MTFPEQDEPYQHGSTVLPGVPLPASAHPHAPAAPPVPASADPAPSGTSPAEPATSAEPAGAKAPWWKMQIGGSNKAAEPVTASDEPADAGPVAPTLPPPSAPRVDLAPPVTEPVAEPTTPAADAPPAAPDPSADGPTAGPAVPAAPRGRHAAAAPAPEASPRRSRTLLLAVIGLVLVLAAVAAFVWPGFLVSSGDDDAGALQSSSPSASALAVTLETPATIDGLRRFTGAADKALAASVAKASVAGLTDPVSAVYGKGTTPQVQVIAWKAVSPPAEDTVTAAFTGFEGSTGAKVTAVREVEVPGLGGHMECGLATVEKTKTLQCFWADDASFGAVTVLSASNREKATSTAVAVRTAVEQTD